MSSFVEFLKTGELGKLHCGMSKDEVHDLLGEPEAVTPQRNPPIWKYGSLDLVFYRSAESELQWLVSIVIHFHSHPINLPEPEGLTGWPKGDTSFDELRDLLDESAIRVDGGLTSGPDQYFVLSSGVRITFDEGRLYSASYTLRHEPEMKQITISIPRGDMKVIQQEAAAAGVSVSKLCSRWILERASSLLPS